MSSNLQNSIWPNEGGTLGQNKVQIPDGVTTPWPEGDALVGNFVFNKGKLVGFVDTKALIANDSKSTTFPYDCVNIQVDKSLEGVMTFNKGERTKYLTITYSGNSGGNVIDTIKYKGCKTVADVKAVDPDYQTNDIVDGVWSEGLGDLELACSGVGKYALFYNCINLTSFSSDLSSLTNGYWMFSKCTNLTSFNVDLSNMTNGESMFYQCSNLNSFNSDLSSLTNSTQMFSGCTALTSFSSDLHSVTDGRYMFYQCYNLESFSSDLSNMTNGMYMFSQCTSLTSFNGDLSSLTNGKLMFSDCTNLTSFSSDLSSLTDGNQMFSDCTNLTSFSSDLSSLKEGNSMFNQCYNLTAFNAALSSVTNGNAMFYECTNLTSFTFDLSSVTNGNGMFWNCSKLTSFSSDLSSLTNGYRMFENCETLTSFSSDLSSLTDGSQMFGSCKLDASSVKNIIDTINTYSAKLTLGMGCNDTTEDKDLFAQEVGYADMTSLLATLQAKGWTVKAQYNGRPTTTYGLRRPSEDTLPIFARLEESEDYADYTSEDGSKKYRLTWFHETTGSTDGYTQFNSLEDAAAQMRLTKIEK